MINLKNLKNNIEEIKTDIGKVKLIAVTKKVDITTIKHLKELGLNCFGENIIQNAKEKTEQIDAEWHMIGHLQSNKVKKAVNMFSMIQSVDTIKIAKKINNECEKTGKYMPILIQVNIAQESQKYGFNTKELENALDEISKLKNIKIEGFMMIAPNIDRNETEPYFKEMKKIFDNYKDIYNLKWLSMGMSNDYKIAIKEGSNMVRIGTKLYV